MADNKIFVPHELKTVEIDLEKKIFRVNGEDFGKRCQRFDISCSSANDRDYKEFLKVSMHVESGIAFANFDWNGNKTGESFKEKDK